jgi:hypothetical protein
MTDFSSELFVALLAIIGVVVIISALLSGLIKRGGRACFRIIIHPAMVD